MAKKYFSSCTVSGVKCECFKYLSQEELDYLSKHTLVVNFKKGEFICKQGTFASHVMLVEKGLAKVYIEGLNEILILKIIAEGNLVGLTSVMRGNTVFQYSASAYVDSTIKLIDINVFRELVEKNSQFAFELINTLGNNNLQIYGRFFSLTRKQSYGRLADILLCLSERIYKEREFELYLTRKELAELSDMSTENTIRMLRKFKDDKLIGIDGKKISILDFETLKQISEKG